MIEVPQSPILIPGFCMAGTTGHRSLGMAFVDGTVHAWTALGDGADTTLHAATATAFTKTSGCP